MSVALDSKQIISRLSPQPTGLFTYGSHTALTVPSWHSYHFQYINNVCTWHLLLKFSDPFAELSLLRSRFFWCHAKLPLIYGARDNCSKNHSFEDQAHLISFLELSQGSISVSYSVYLVMSKFLGKITMTIRFLASTSGPLARVLKVVHDARENIKVRWHHKQFLLHEDFKAIVFEEK